MKLKKHKSENGNREQGQRGIFVLKFPESGRMGEGATASCPERLDILKCLRIKGDSPQAAWKPDPRAGREAVPAAIKKQCLNKKRRRKQVYACVLFFADFPCSKALACGPFPAFYDGNILPSRPASPVRGLPERKAHPYRPLRLWPSLHCAGCKTPLLR